MGDVRDTQRPTLVVRPRPRVSNPVTELRVGAFDYGGIKNISVKASWKVQGRREYFELSRLLKPIDDGLWAIAIQPVEKGTLIVSVTDKSGNISTVTRTFGVSDDVPKPAGGLTPLTDKQAARVRQSRDLLNELLDVR